MTRVIIKVLRSSIGGGIGQIQLTETTDHEPQQKALHWYMAFNIGVLLSTDLRLTSKPPTEKNKKPTDVWEQTIYPRNPPRAPVWENLTTIKSWRRSCFARCFGTIVLAMFKLHTPQQRKKKLGGVGAPKKEQYSTTWQTAVRSWRRNSPRLLGLRINT